MRYEFQLLESILKNHFLQFIFVHLLARSPASSIHTRYMDEYLSCCIRVIWHTDIRTYGTIINRDFFLRTYCTCRVPDGHIRTYVKFFGVEVWDCSDTRMYALYMSHPSHMSVWTSLRPYVRMSVCQITWIKQLGIHPCMFTWLVYARLYVFGGRRILWKMNSSDERRRLLNQRLKVKWRERRAREWKFKWEGGKVRKWSEIAMRIIKKIYLPLWNFSCHWAIIKFKYNGQCALFIVEAFQVFSLSVSRYLAHCPFTLNVRCVTRSHIFKCLSYIPS